ncbi:MAG TPA: hypothetical protein VJ695_00725 [Nitrososphaera sp.]|nr:hypothetical protein [Nitrososphaera sp.]
MPALSPYNISATGYTNFALAATARLVISPILFTYRTKVTAEPPIDCGLRKFISRDSSASITNALPIQISQRPTFPSGVAILIDSSSLAPKALL